MKTKIILGVEKMDIKEMVDSLLNDAVIVEKMFDYINAWCEDFIEVKTRAESSVEVLNEAIGVEVVNALIMALKQQIASDIRFATSQGLKANISEFRNPSNIVILNQGLECYIQESVMLNLPARKEAEKTAMEIINKYGINEMECFAYISEFHTFLETVCPKLAHFYSYITANKILALTEPGYVPNLIQTMKYTREMKKHFGVPDDKSIPLL